MLSLSTIPLLNIWLGERVVSARKKFGVNLPLMYTDEDDKQTFNYIQRGHQNALESIPQVLVTGGLSGFFFPRFASGSIIVYVLGRIGYALGYENGPDGRFSKLGFLHIFGQLGLLGTTILSGASLLDWVDLTRFDFFGK